MRQPPHSDPFFVSITHAVLSPLKSEAGCIWWFMTNLWYGLTKYRWKELRQPLGRKWNLDLSIGSRACLSMLRGPTGQGRISHRPREIAAIFTRWKRFGWGYSLNCSVVEQQRTVLFVTGALWHEIWFLENIVLHIWNKPAEERQHRLNMMGRGSCHGNHLRTCFE